MKKQLRKMTPDEAIIKFMAPMSIGVTTSAVGRVDKTLFGSIQHHMDIVGFTTTALVDFDIRRQMSSDNGW